MEKGYFHQEMKIRRTLVDRHLRSPATALEGITYPGQGAGSLRVLRICGLWARDGAGHTLDCAQGKRGSRRGKHHGFVRENTFRTVRAPLAQARRAATVLVRVARTPRKQCLNVSTPLQADRSY